MQLVLINYLDPRFLSIRSSIMLCTADLESIPYTEKVLNLVNAQHVDSQPKLREVFNGQDLYWLVAMLQNEYMDEVTLKVHVSDSNIAIQVISYEREIHTLLNYLADLSKRGYVTVLSQYEWTTFRQKCSKADIVVGGVKCQ